MFGIRTPVKCSKDSKSPAQPQNVRRSIGEWETKGPKKTNQSPEQLNKTGTTKATPPIGKIEKKATTRNDTPQDERIAEARACVVKAKTKLGEAKNLKTEIKVEVIKSLDRLLQLIKESHKALEQNSNKDNCVFLVTPDEERRMKDTKTGAESMPDRLNKNEELPENREDKVFQKIEENNQLLRENQKKLEEIKMELQQRTLAPESIAQPAPSVPMNILTPQNDIPRKVLHSIVVSSKVNEDTSDTVLEKVRNQVKAKEGWVKIEKARKAKNQKVVLSCNTIEERKKVKEIIEKADLVAEEVRNRDPLLIIRDVLLINSDEDVLMAIRNQNKGLFHGLSEEEIRLEIKYKKRARNPHVQHLVLSTSPILWQRAIEMGSLLIDLQRIRVADQTPLVQCTRCLGYGHTKRFCLEALDCCSHCGGPHFSSTCPDKLAGIAPNCRNCLRAKLDNRAHNSFHQECPIRKRWDEIARSTVAYC